jgi:ribose transport system permease protein
VSGTGSFVGESSIEQVEPSIFGTVTPGEETPEYNRWLTTLKPPVIPVPIIASVALALVGLTALMRSAYDVVLMRADGNTPPLKRFAFDVNRVWIHVV